jgi:predicted kinase
MKKLILISAIAGSGKSTLAAQLEKQYEDQGYSVFTIETDEWFVRNGRGTYKFERDKLNQAHSWTFSEVAKAMMEDSEERTCTDDPYDVIILANTNLVWKEIKRYVVLAREMGYEVEIVAPDTPWCNNPEECFQKNIHGVPLDQLKRMEEKRQPIEYLRQKIKESFEESYKW